MQNSSALFRTHYHLLVVYETGGLIAHIVYIVAVSLARFSVSLLD